MKEVQIEITELENQRIRLSERINIEFIRVQKSFPCVGVA